MICYWDFTQKKSGMDCQASRNICGIILLLLSYICGLRGGVVFSGPLPEGRALGGTRGLAALPAGWEEERRGKNGEEGGLSGGLERPFPARLLFQFIGPPHTHPHTGTDAQQRQSQDVTSSTGREAKQLFLLFLCLSVLLREVGDSRSVRGWQRRRGSRGAGGGREAGSVFHREFEVEGVQRLNPPWTSQDLPPHSKPSAAGFQPGTVQIVFFFFTPFPNLFTLFLGIEICSAFLFFFFFSVCPVHDVCRSSVSGANSTTTMKVCRTERDQTCFSLRLLRHAARRKVIKIEVTLSHMLSLIYLQAIIVFSIKHLQKALSKANVCLKLPVSQSRAESNTMTMRASLGSPFVMDTFRAISWPRIHGPPVVSFEMRSGSLWKLVETKSTLLIYQMLLIQLLIHTSEQQKLRA